MTARVCSQCGAALEGDSKFCKYCGTNNGINEEVNNNQTQYQNPVYSNPIHSTEPVGIKVPVKSKVTAGLLAIFLGGFGIHKFYLGKIFQGILYILFCWTYIPSIISFIEGIIYLTKSDEAWAEKVGYRYR
ncbi:TM2 domain-containing membrane protein YozV [Clostridium moniliforme]|uniref:TM2 domain-containing membrane protein YozV n=1 Tax=Clostridium moniliforme TaxID=39489 RepID=A0ABS4EYT8_9CLOT|nr:TM2 domain-containing protein [Clostridium moniliforme]MBP1889159.1 TM2 domain-containing membrane protein YozV [Clostridium moniliforme]